MAVNNNVEREVDDMRGKNDMMHYDGTCEKSVMFPITCADGLFQIRLTPQQHETLLVMGGARVFGFKNRVRDEIKKTLRIQGYMSVAAYVRQVIEGKAC